MSPVTVDSPRLDCAFEKAKPPEEKHVAGGRFSAMIPKYAAMQMTPVLYGDIKNTTSPSSEAPSTPTPLKLA